ADVAALRVGCTDGVRVSHDEIVGFAHATQSYARWFWGRIKTVELTPREKDKLLIFTAGLLAERRKGKGLKLNYPEAVAFISAALLEGAREGRSVSDLRGWGATLLRRDEVMEGVPEMIPEMQAEASF